jgi:hypothetical protein
MQIFVCYSREDRGWFDQYRLISFLEQSVARDGVHVWFDVSRKGIGAGEVWRQEIANAIEQSSIAVLLVSQDFLNSDVIMSFELPLIKARAAQGALKVLPILVGQCDYSADPFLSERQILPGGEPLIQFVGDEARWDTVRAEILLALKRKIVEVRAGSAGHSGSPVRPPRPAAARTRTDDAPRGRPGGPEPVREAWIRRRGVLGFWLPAAALVVLAAIAVIASAQRERVPHRSFDFENDTQNWGEHPLNRVLVVGQGVRRACLEQPQARSGACLLEFIPTATDEDAFVTVGESVLEPVVEGWINVIEPECDAFRCSTAKIVAWDQDWGYHGGPSVELRPGWQRMCFDLRERGNRLPFREVGIQVHRFGSWKDPARAIYIDDVTIRSGGRGGC